LAKSALRSIYFLNAPLPQKLAGGSFGAKPEARDLSPRVPFCAETGHRLISPEGCSSASEAAMISAYCNLLMAAAAWEADV